MKITEIKYEKKITMAEKPAISKYGYEVLSLEGVVGDGENRDLAILNLMESVHAHLDIEMESKILSNFKKLAESRKNSGTVLTEKDAVPSDPQLDRPQKVDDAADTRVELQERGNESEGTDKPTEDKPREAKKDNGKEVEPKADDKVKGSKEKETKKEVKETKSKKAAIPYDRTNPSHKTDMASLLDELTDKEWQTEGSKIRVRAGAASVALNGSDMYSGATNKLLAKFKDSLRKELGL